MIHGRIAAVSSSSPSVAVPGPHVSCDIPGLHPWASWRALCINPYAALLAPELGGTKNQRPPWPRGWDLCWR